MKHKNKLLIVSILVVISLTIIPIVKADSGFDSSWDSGSSSSWDSDSSSSSWDSGSNWGSSNNNRSYDSNISSTKNNVGFFPFIITVFFVFAILYLNNKGKKNNKVKTDVVAELELLDVNKYNMEKRLEIEAFNIYAQLQHAWMNFDYDTIRKLTTDEMYNMYSMQLDTLKVKNQKNIMSNIKYLNSFVKETKETNNINTIKIQMTVSCYDYLINTNTNKIERGNSNRKNIYTYELTFVKTNNKETIKKCPQCGAPVEGNNGGVCEYCKSTLINKDYTLILSKKEMIKQK